MDYNYRYIISYMYMYALTTKFLFIFSRVLYIYCQLKLIDQHLKSKCKNQRAAPSHYMEYLFCFIGF